MEKRFKFVPKYKRRRLGAEAAKRAGEAYGRALAARLARLNRLAVLAAAGPAKQG